MEYQNQTPTQCHALMTTLIDLDGQSTSQLMTLLVVGSEWSIENDLCHSVWSEPIYSHTIQVARGTCKLPELDGPADPSNDEGSRTIFTET